MNLTTKKLTVSTLLIPEKFFDFFKENADELMREEYFSILLNRFKELALCGLFPKSEKAKTAHQEEGQSLVKVKFRPKNEDWVELGIIANYPGITRTACPAYVAWGMCWALFSWFLLLDFAGWSEILSKRFFETGVPAKLNPILAKSILLRRITCIWRRKIYYKIRR